MNFIISLLWGECENIQNTFREYQFHFETADLKKEQVYKIKSVNNKVILELVN